MSPIAVNITGQKFGRLTAIKFSHKTNDLRMWLCKCECGNEICTSVNKLRSGNTTSCGCYQKERVSETFFKHGRSNDTNYKSWQAMKNRCGNPDSSDYAYYGGKGITYDPEWEDFQKFLKDMGPKPSPSYTIERNDSNKNYTKENCRWATRLEQAQNLSHSARLKYGTEELTYAELSRRTGISEWVLRNRIRDLKMSVEEAIKNSSK